MKSALNLDIRKLRSFISIVDNGGVSKAAVELSQTQGAISQQIKKLESDLRSDLFSRDEHTLRLTEFGQLFQKHARRLLAVHDEILVETLEPDICGKVTIGLPWDLINRIGIPTLLRRFGEQNTQVEIAMKCASTPNLLDGLKSGKIDLALMQEYPASQEGELLVPDRVVWIGAENGKAVHTEILPLAMTNPTCSFRRFATDALDRSGQKWRFAYETDSLELMLAMIRMDLAVGVLLESAVPAGLTVLSSTERLPDLPQFNVTLKTSSNPTPACHKLAQLFREGVGRSNGQ